eukprot:3740870-Pyramimonas_sp.AAC.1
MHILGIQHQRWYIGGGSTSYPDAWIQVRERAPRPSLLPVQVRRFRPQAVSLRGCLLQGGLSAAECNRTE